MTDVVDYFLQVTFAKLCKIRSLDDAILEEDQRENASTANYLIEQIADISFSMLLLTKLIGIGISVLNVALNTMCLIVFFQWNKGPMVRLLIFLTICEILLNLAWLLILIIYIFLVYTNEDFPEMTRHFAYGIYGIVLPMLTLFANGTILLRNWTVVVIALARFEAIKYPFKVNKFCAGKSLLALLLLLVAISFVYGFARIFEYKIIVCESTYKILMHQLHLFAQQLYERVILNLIYCISQGLCPAITMAILNLCLIHEIHLASKVSLNCHNRNNAKEGFKNRTIILLCATFFILETPQCGSFIMGSLGVIPIPLARSLLSYAALLVMLDSTANCWIYMSSSKRFRRSIMELVSRSITSSGTQSREGLALKNSASQEK